MRDAVSGPGEALCSCGGGGWGCQGAVGEVNMLEKPGFLADVCAPGGSGEKQNGHRQNTGQETDNKAAQWPFTPSPFLPSCFPGHWRTGPSVFVPS